METEVVLEGVTTHVDEETGEMRQFVAVVDPAWHDRARPDEYVICEIYDGVIRQLFTCYAGSGNPEDTMKLWMSNPASIVKEHQRRCKAIRAGRGYTQYEVVRDPIPAPGKAHKKTGGYNPYLFDDDPYGFDGPDLSGRPSYSQVGRKKKKGLDAQAELGAEIEEELKKDKEKD